MTLIDELVEAICPDNCDALFIASAIKKMSLFFKNANVSFDVNELIDAILLKLGENGSLIIPAYTDTLQNGDEFSRTNSKPTIGALPARAFKRTDYFRTNDPLHSAFIWGPMQNCNYKALQTFGENSLFYNMHQKNVLQVFLDVDLQNSFTFIHYVESIMDVHYRKDYSMQFSVDGQNKELIFNTRKPGYITNLVALQKKMLADGVLSKKMFHGISIYSIYSETAFDYLKKEIEVHGGKEWRRFSMKEYFRRHMRRIVKGKSI